MEEHPQARYIVDTLCKAGYIAYYAGGWVRDFLLGHPSDDIDIATSAKPEAIQTLFPHTVPIGIAFGIVLVIVDGLQYEVATFRQDIDYQDGRRPTSIAFTNAEEDAKRRDFTINGMFYDPHKEEVLDFVGGKADLEAQIIRAIGNPHDRIKEDRLRMIRAIRLACRFNFQIEAATQAAIRAHAKELFPAVAIERVVQELTKGHAFGTLRKMLSELHAFGLLSEIFPELEIVSQQALDERLEPLTRYPKSTPLIAMLLPLFPSSTLDNELKLCKRLKLSNLDMRFVAFLFCSKELIQEEIKRTRLIEDVEWAYFYAHLFCPTALQILAAHLDSNRSERFLKTHEERIRTLDPAIQRVREHRPVVTSNDLMEAGVQPGKAMGVLLKEAERIAFNEKIYEPGPILNQLRTSIFWPS